MTRNEAAAYLGVDLLSHIFYYIRNCTSIQS